jgi:hypothetical protein
MDSQEGEIKEDSRQENEKGGGVRGLEKNRRKSKNEIEKFSILSNNYFGWKAKKKSLYQTI